MIIEETGWLTWDTPPFSSVPDRQKIADVMDSTGVYVIARALSEPPPSLVIPAICYIGRADDEKLARRVGAFINTVSIYGTDTHEVGIAYREKYGSALYDGRSHICMFATSMSDAKKLEAKLLDDFVKANGRLPRFNGRAEK